MYSTPPLTPIQFDVLNSSLSLSLYISLKINNNRAAMAAPYHEASLSSPPPPPSAAAAAPPSNKWGPYSGAGDFGTSMLIILAALFVALFLAATLAAAIRFLFCAAARRRPSPADPEKQVARPPAAEAEGTTLVFSAGTRLARAEAECAICLAEFVEGDGLRVLAPCNHGFHVRCIERWLAARSTCPTCRSSCHVAVGPERKSPAMEEGGAG
ncbi:RING-H2 finger protein ATL79-like [Phoenix dactylifera]|uniref:RING-H2 finger protein ATL79-like n=1 Tax=Phoenix dactylifera TaxID=42345 RepID=A0A8B7D5T3_PHODC|nr:RING-H2 finger protein ATL79-like [Phoenix dactylifera]